MYVNPFGEPSPAPRGREPVPARKTMHPRRRARLKTGGGLGGAMDNAFAGAVLGLTANLAAGPALLFSRSPESDAAYRLLIADLPKTGTMSDEEFGKYKARARRHLSSAAANRLQRHALAIRRGQAAPNSVPPDIERLRKPKLEDTRLYKYSKWARDYRDEHFPVDPKYRDHWAVKTAEFTGGVAPLAALGIASGGTGLALALGAGAASSAGEKYVRARAEGATENQARNAAFWSGVYGTTDALPPLRAVRKGASVARHWLPNSFAKTAGDVSLGAVQSAGASVVDNAISRQFYDPDRSLFDGTLDAATTGAIGTGVFSAGAQGFRAGRAAVRRRGRRFGHSASEKVDGREDLTAPRAEPAARPDAGDPGRLPKTAGPSSDRASDRIGAAFEVINRNNRAAADQTAGLDQTGATSGSLASAIASSPQHSATSPTHKLILPPSGIIRSEPSGESLPLSTSRFRNSITDRSEPDQIGSVAGSSVTHENSIVQGDDYSRRLVSLTTNVSGQRGIILPGDPEFSKTPAGSQNTDHARSLIQGQEELHEAVRAGTLSPKQMRRLPHSSTETIEPGKLRLEFGLRTTLEIPEAPYLNRSTSAIEPGDGAQGETPLFDGLSAVSGDPGTHENNTVYAHEVLLGWTPSAPHIAKIPAEFWDDPELPPMVLRGPGGIVAIQDRDGRYVLITDLKKRDNHLRGRYGETLADWLALKRGWTIVSHDGEPMTMTTPIRGPGIDSIYKVNPKIFGREYLVNEVKSMRSPIGDTIDGRQLRELWIQNSVNKMFNVEAATNIIDSYFPLLQRYDNYGNIVSLNEDGTSFDKGPVK